MAKAKPKKSKGLLGRAASLLGSIPAVGNVFNAGKKVGKKAGKAAKSVNKTFGKAKKTVGKVAKVSQKNLKKKFNKKKKQVAARFRKGKKKLRKKAGKFFTKARKLKNNLSPKKLVQKMKKSINKKVLAAKKGIKKVKTTINKAGKSISKTIAVTKAIGKTMALAAKKDKDLVKKVVISATASMASFVTDFIPYVSNVKAAYEASYGIDPFTREKLDTVDRSFAAASIALGPVGKVFKRGKQGLEGLDEAIDAAEEIVSAIEKSKVTPPKKDKTPGKGTGNATNQVTKRSDPATYYTYDELRAMTKESGLTGRNVGFESHHLLSKQFASKFGVSQGDIISAPLTPMNHRGSGGEKIIGAGMNINNAIQKELKNIVGTNTERAAVKNATPEQIWQAHRNVYEKMGNSDWAKAIYDAHVRHLGIPYE